MPFKCGRKPPTNHPKTKDKDWPRSDERESAGIEYSTLCTRASRVCGVGVGGGDGGVASVVVRLKASYSLSRRAR